VILKLNKTLFKMSLSEIYDSRELDQFISEYYPNHPTKLLSVATGLEAETLFKRAYKLGLRKTKEFRQKALIEISKTLSENGKAHRFKPGHTPLNKGKAMPPQVYEKAKATMFKPGQMPHNTKHDGHISIRRDKNGRDYAYIRVRQGEYKLLHRVLWEQNNGTIPKNMIVAFKNGNSLDCTLANMELITKEENMRRNSLVSKYPPDIVAAIRTNAGLKRRIRKLEERW
jgi:hypothetical protein